jgi:hypothetical protein
MSNFISRTLFDETQEMEVAMQSAAKARHQNPGSEGQIGHHH